MISPGNLTKNQATTVFHVTRSTVFSGGNINQSINRSINTPGEVRLSGATAKSMFNIRIDGTVPWHQWAVGCAGV